VVLHDSIDRRVSLKTLFSKSKSRNFGPLKSFRGKICFLQAPRPAPGVSKPYRSRQHRPTIPPRVPLDFHYYACQHHTFPAPKNDE
jgi:hypothetical protein